MHKPFDERAQLRIRMQPLSLCQPAAKRSTDRKTCATACKCSKWTNHIPAGEGAFPCGDESLAVFILKTLLRLVYFTQYLEGAFPWHVKTFLGEIPCTVYRRDFSLAWIATSLITHCFFVRVNQDVLHNICCFKTCFRAGLQFAYHRGLKLIKKIIYNQMISFCYNW